MGAACGPDGILCGNTSGAEPHDYISTRSYWMRKRGDSPAMVASFQRMAWDFYIPHIAAEEVLQKQNKSPADLEKMRAQAKSEQDWGDYFASQLPGLAKDLVGLADIEDCLAGEGFGSCLMALAGAVPIGKLRFWTISQKPS